MAPAIAGLEKAWRYGYNYDFKYENRYDYQYDYGYDDRYDFIACRYGESSITAAEPRNRSARNLRQPQQHDALAAARPAAAVRVLHWEGGSPQGGPEPLGQAC